MLSTSKKSTELRTRKEPKEETKKEEITKRVISTPRDFVQKSSTADIYAQKKKTQSQNAPKKVAGTITNITNNVSPMKKLLKSSSSSVSQRSVKKADTKNIASRKTEAPKAKPPFTNVTVNSPVLKRKIDLNSAPKILRKESQRKEVENATKEYLKEGKERQRTKTRTLDESEVKMLAPVDNNAEMLNLTQKLVAKPKSFYIDLDEDKTKVKPLDPKSSDEEISYEDDFESYESDFDSYHSERSEADENNEASERGEASEHNAASENSHIVGSKYLTVLENSLRDGNEEKMLDSGNFDLRDRSAKSKPEVMGFILETSEDQKTVSLTDEGFQDMSTASAGSSIKTLDVLDRPVFLDFTKAKQNKVKRKLYERLKQRAADLLSMITLHEMSYTLFEMQPISYDLYMATFGRNNYTQSGTQTFEDAITEEVQTEEVEVTQKWTQHPVEFSKADVYLSMDGARRKFSRNTEDFVTKFKLLLKENNDIEIANVDDNYTNNPLRIYFEQKNGAGEDKMLPYEAYKSKLKSNAYNSNRLGKFLKKYETGISRILSKNTGHKDTASLTKSTQIPFSKGFISLAKTISDEKFSFLMFSKINRIIFSENKLNLILTVHKNAKCVDVRKNLVCLWDLSAASEVPMKVLTAVDDVIIGKFRGDSNGLFAAALEDGSIHLWDLSEDSTWRADVVTDKKPTELVEIDAEKLTEFEKDREWNLKNRHVGLQRPPPTIALQSCAYSNSAYNMSADTRVDAIVGLEVNADVIDMDRRVLGQIISLQRIGVLTIWSIIQDKLKSTQDIGKSYSSNIKLEKYQTIQLTDHIDFTKGSNENIPSFNLNSAKKRILLRKQEKTVIKKQISRPQSSVSSKFDFDFDRPASAASLRKKVLSIEINVPKNWETGVVCADLKVVQIKNIVSYLVAKNLGEVLICRRCLGAVKVERFLVTNDTSSVCSIEVPNNGLPYFLASTDTGTVNLCSLLDHRVLLTLDCRNVPSIMKCQSDHKGRYISSVSWRPEIAEDKFITKMQVKSVLWSTNNPCAVYVLLQDKSLLMFELTHSDIYAKYVCENAAVFCTINDDGLALLTPAGEVQVHRLSNETRAKENLNVFEKYVSLL